MPIEGELFVKKIEECGGGGVEVALYVLARSIVIIIQSLITYTYTQHPPPNTIE